MTSYWTYKNIFFKSNLLCITPSRWWFSGGGVECEWWLLSDGHPCSIHAVVDPMEFVCQCFPNTTHEPVDLPSGYGVWGHRGSESVALCHVFVSRGVYGPFLLLLCHQNWLSKGLGCMELPMAMQRQLQTHPCLLVLVVMKVACVLVAHTSARTEESIRLGEYTLLSKILYAINNQSKQFLSCRVIGLYLS